MANYQLWSRDEYGQGSILMNSENLFEVIQKAKREITDINVNNALTSADRERNWEAYMVMVVPKTRKNKTDYIYCGDNPRAKDKIYKITEQKVELCSLKDFKDLVLRIYLGDISTSRKEEKDWFATDIKGNIIDSPNHPDLQGKSFFFVKII